MGKDDELLLYGWMLMIIDNVHCDCCERKTTVIDLSIMTYDEKHLYICEHCLAGIQAGLKKASARLEQNNGKKRKIK
jgi:hypothetical protein